MPMRDLVGRRYPLKRGGYLELEDGVDGLHVYRTAEDDGLGDHAHIRHLPPAWLLAMSHETMLQFIKDLGDHGISWGMTGEDGGDTGERLRREDAAFERAMRGR